MVNSVILQNLLILIVLIVPTLHTIPTSFIHSRALLYIFNILKCLFLIKSALLAKIVSFSCEMFVFVENALIFAPIFVCGDTEKPALCDLKVRF